MNHNNLPFSARLRIMKEKHKETQKEKDSVENKAFFFDARGYGCYKDPIEIAARQLLPDEGENYSRIYSFESHDYARKIIKALEDEGFRIMAPTPPEKLVQTLFKSIKEWKLGDITIYDVWIRTFETARKWV